MKKKQFKLKITGLILTAVLVMSAFTGCSCCSDDASSTASDTSAASDISAVNAESSETSEISDISSTIQSVSTVSEQIYETESSVAQVQSTAVSTAQSSSETAVSSETVSTAPAMATASGDYISYTKTGAAELSEWYMRVVNYNNVLPSGWAPDNLVVVKDTYKLDSRAAEAYNDLVSAAWGDGVSLYPVSCYRTYETQDGLFQNRVTRVLNDQPDLSRKEAENVAAGYVARPRTSEHECGLAVDFNSVETSFADTQAGRWLKSNAADYGFILRYEQDKQSITKVTYEPWHYRFVGVKHAKKMNELGYCLEEYVAYIQKGGK